MASQVGIHGRVAVLSRKGWEDRVREADRACDIEVVPFGETVLYRMPEVARDRHQALEERWAMGVWLRHARSTNSAFVATDEGIIKTRGIRRLPAGQEWDGEKIRSIKGSPKN